ncbi:MAG: hypothetical protein WCV68_00380 [Candidatus Paceibacterota bacterium]
MLKLNTWFKNMIEGWLAAVLSMNIVGVARAVVAWPLELYCGLSLLNMWGFRIVSLVVDGILALPFWLGREGLYRTGLINRENSLHRFTLDTISFSISKSLSYVFCLGWLTNLQGRTFWLLVIINVFLLITTGGFNCWHIDVMRKQLPDLTRKLLAWRLRLTRRWRKHKN